MVVIADIYTRPSNLIRTTEANGTTVARWFQEDWKLNHGVPSKALTHHGLHVPSEFLVAECMTLGANNITTNEYYRKFNLREELFNFSVI